MKVLFRLVLMCSLLLLQGYFFLRPTANPGHLNRVRVIMPRGVDQFTAFTNNFEQRTSVKQHSAQGTGTPIDAETIIEAEEEEENETAKKQTTNSHHHPRTSDYFSSGLFVAATHNDLPQEQQQVSPPGYKNIFHCVFRI